MRATLHLPLLVLISGALLATALVLDPAPAAVSEPVAYRTFAREMMATRIEVVLPDGPRAARAAEAVFAAFQHVEEVANEWREDSPLAAVNRAAGGAPVPVPRDLFDLLRRGRDLGDLTGGAFDVTWAALWGLWDFSREHPVVPDPADLRARAALVDYRLLELDDERLTARLPRAGMRIGLGGIAKGWALDRAAAELRGMGIDSFSLSAGGQVTVGGLRGDRPWRIGIRDPRGPREDAFALVEATDVSVSTSGDYERWFVKDGVRHHHVLDPRTGQPARGVRSATVIARDGTLADALSTALMILGPERGIALAERLAGVEAVMVDEGGRLWATLGAMEVLVPLHPPRR